MPSWSCGSATTASIQVRSCTSLLLRRSRLSGWSRTRAAGPDRCRSEQFRGPPVVFCHGTPWSSAVWRPVADALSADFTVHLWDMLGYGTSTKVDGQDVSLSAQAALLADLLDHWGLADPHMVAHDYGGAVALRAHLLHHAEYNSLALVDVVALAPWGSEFFRLVADNSAVFAWIPVDRAYRLAELIPGSELHLVPEAGHLIHFDAPERLTAVLQRWLLSQEF